MRPLIVQNFNACLSRQSLKCNFRSLSNTALRNNDNKNKGLFQYAQAEAKCYIKVLGPDAPKFLNGLVMSKLLPHHIKKNLTTINPDEQKQPRIVPEFDNTKGNWGTYVEWSDNGPYVTRFGTYTGLLNSKGKLVSDTIIYPTPLVGSKDAKINKYPTYLLEFDSSIVDQVLTSFNTHKLSSRVKVKKVDENALKTWDVQIQLPGVPKDIPNPWLVDLLEPSTSTKTPETALNFAKGMISALFHTHEQKIEALYIERRTESRFYQDGSLPQVLRIITKSDTDDVSELFNPVGLPIEFEIERRSPQYFRAARFEAGYIDSARDFEPETLLPLELNFDFLPNALSADKGCYVGQELTARTLSTGILRKRLIPVSLSNMKENGSISVVEGKYPEIKLKNTVEPPTHDSPSSSLFVNTSAPNPALAKPRRQRPAGALISHEGDKGVALMRVEHFARAFKEGENSDIFYIQTEKRAKDVTHTSHRIDVMLHRPFWLEMHEFEEP